MDLKEWSINYVKNRDLMQRKLVSFEEKDSSVHFVYKDKTEDHIIKEVLDESVLSFRSSADIVTFVCINTEENLEFLIKKWNELKTDSRFRFLFVNLISGAKWIISPYTHNKIADPESLETGLKSMFDQVTSE